MVVRIQWIANTNRQISNFFLLGLTDEETVTWVQLQGEKRLDSDLTSGEANTTVHVLFVYFGLFLFCLFVCLFARCSDKTQIWSAEKRRPVSDRAYIPSEGPRTIPLKALLEQQPVSGLFRQRQLRGHSWAPAMDHLAFLGEAKTLLAANQTEKRRNLEE